MTRAIQTETQLLEAMNVTIANDWKHPGHHCLVTRLKPSNAPGCNWEIDTRHRGGESLAHLQECDFLIERAYSELSTKYDVAWPEAG